MNNLRNVYASKVTLRMLEIIESVLDEIHEGDVKDSIFSKNNYIKDTLNGILFKTINYMRFNAFEVVSMVVLLDRMIAANKEVVNRKSINCIICILALLVSKFNRDESHENIFVNKKFGIPLKMVNKMEREALKILEFKVMVTDEDFNEYGKVAKD